MREDFDINLILAQAREKGYFDPEDFPKLRLNPQEFIFLREQLNKKKIPWGSSEENDMPTKNKAIEIINSLRRGIPAADGTRYYSVGQEYLLSEIRTDFSSIENGKSIVRFLNADIGGGKTHTLYRLREFAFECDYVVSIVTLSQNSCPLYDFMSVYHEIMWGLRTKDQQNKPALTNIIDRWVADVKNLGRSAITDIVENKLPKTIREIMAAYVDSTNLLRKDEQKRQTILKFLGGERVSKYELKRVGIDNAWIDSSNALHILSEVAVAIKNIGFKGICVFFDEAESVYSFATSKQREQAFVNLQQIINQSKTFPHCYFIYATTPSFFDAYGYDWAKSFYAKPFLKLEELGADQREEIGDKIIKLYNIAYDVNVPPAVQKAIYKAANSIGGNSIGNYIRKVVAILDDTCR